MKKIPLKWLGIIAMAGAPGLWIESCLYDTQHHQNTSLGGVFDLLYMIGWMCSIYGLLQLRAAGSKRMGKLILQVQIGLLIVANSWNIWEIIDPASQHPLYRALDMFWPVSNVFMFITGLAVLFGKRLTGFPGFIPLIVSLWLPVTMVAFTFLKNDHAGFYIMNVYSTVAWLLMGWVVYRNRKKTFHLRKAVSTQVKTYTPECLLTEEAF